MNYPNVMRIQHDMFHSFVQDFQLESPEHMICFEATLEFVSEGLYKRFTSEIYIHSVLDQHILYILDPAVHSFNLPDRYVVSSNNMYYEKMQSLVLRNVSNMFGIFLLKIFPMRAGCREVTLLELHQRLFN